VAIDVVAELQPLGEPDEYVNLAPTTGPVPVMVPNSPRPEVAGPVEKAVEETVVDAVEEDVDESVLDTEAGDTEAVDSDATDSGATVEQLVVEEVEESAIDEVVEELVEEITVEETTVEEITVEEITVEEIEDEIEIEVAIDEVDEGGDDVVVDLFARLRAEAVTVEPVDETEPADDVAADVEDVVELVEAGELDEPVDIDENVEPTPFEQRDADLTPIIVGAARKLKRVLADEQNEVLEALRRNEPVRALDALLPPVGDHTDRYAQAISDDVSAAAQAGAAMVAPTGSGPLRKADAAAATKAGDDVLGEWLVVPLRERLERCVLDGDGDNAGIGKRVRAVYREWKTQHIDEQLDDVIRTAHGRGVLAAIGTGTSVVWVCDDTRQGCSDCDDNSLAGSISAGEAFPTGHLCAPAHIGCRCILLPAGR